MEIENGTGEEKNVLIGTAKQHMRVVLMVVDDFTIWGVLKFETTQKIS